ncbi:ABC transporter substrate-binding protein [Parendozoicomonas haliclonae]|uniref:Protein YnjB n=1 Tax=Parendozoicomonas haliclonae TaxID=1960125 RepID=A0A1X7AMB5_9GAMM|nr:ABC transporter substrate-binding protein [Parendozoicomonas haliclonae]SMA49393.1 hypothetical protein EHSB41UT_03230 [Parendozoicomonas haliclonae]
MPRKTLLTHLIILALLVLSSFTRAETWPQTLEQAKGKTVYMNAWGGSENINSYLDWAGEELNERYGITLKHVKVDDIASVVSRIVAEKSAGRESGGSVDIMWINGENFRAMKDNKLLHGPFVENLPNWQFIDPVEKPTTIEDFGHSVDGLEAPWGMAQLVFMVDTDRVSQKPTSMQELLAFSQKNPGLFTYPAPPDFIGTTFLKQALIELAPDAKRLKQPVGDDFEQVTQPLWAFLDALHPTLWRKGATFPASSSAMLPLLDDGEIAFAQTFNPSTATTAIHDGLLPETVRTYVHKAGTIGNSHFLAIPYNASAKAAAEVTINFLMSPEAQLRKANPKIWGDPTVLSLSKLPLQQQQQFRDQEDGIATLSQEQLGTALQEPDASWMNALEQAWLKRYR